MKKTLTMIGCIIVVVACLADGRKPPNPKLVRVRKIFIKGDNKAAAKAREHLDDWTCLRAATTPEDAEATLTITQYNSHEWRTFTPPKPELKHEQYPDGSIRRETAVYENQKQMSKPYSWQQRTVGVDIVLQDSHGETLWSGSNVKIDKQGKAVWKGHNDSEEASVKYVISGLKKEACTEK